MMFSASKMLKSYPALFCLISRMVRTDSASSTLTSHGTRNVREDAKTSQFPSSWDMITGSGKMSPTGSELKTNEYLILYHREFGITLELFYGSTGAIMFQEGLNSSIQVYFLQFYISRNFLLIIGF